MPRRPTRSSAVAIFLSSFLGALGCGGPRIRLFEASPHVVCEGEKAVVRWDADGELALALEAEPALDGDGSCASSGRDTILLTLVARRKGEEAERKVEVVQLHGSATEPVVLRTNVLEGTDVVARDDKNVALWGDRVEVVAVAACRGRAVQVRHAGKVASLAADGTPSAALSGTVLGGPWELRSPLTMEEQKNPSRRPNQLEVVATIRCRPEKR